MAEKKRIWDNYKVIGEVRKSEAIKLVVAAACRDGVRYICVREFYLTKRSQEWKPGRDGIVIPMEIPINKGADICQTYAGFMTELTKAAHEVTNMPLADEKNAVYIEVKEKTK